MIYKKGVFNFPFLSLALQNGDDRAERDKNYNSAAIRDCIYLERIWYLDRDTMFCLRKLLKPLDAVQVSIPQI